MPSETELGSKWHFTGRVMGRILKPNTNEIFKRHLRQKENIHMTKWQSDKMESYPPESVVFLEYVGYLFD